MRSTVFAVAFSTMSVFACGSDTPTGNGPPAVASVVVTPDAATLVSLRETVQFVATASDGNGNTISGKTFTWFSSDTSIATVNASGLMTAVTNGTAAVTATTDGISGSASVTVAYDGWPLGLTGSLAVVARNPINTEVLEESTYHVSIRSGIQDEWTTMFEGTLGRFCCSPLGHLTAAPDGRTLAFDIVRDNGASAGLNSIWRINADGSADLPLYVAGLKPVYSADGSLAYSTFWFNCGDENQVYQTCGVAVDGQVVIPCASILGARQPRCEPAVSWFPDSDAMAIVLDSSIIRGSVSAMSAMERIYADPDGKVLRQPAVAPSGDAIAFVRVMDEIGSHYQLWVVNANGSDPRRLTTGYDDRHPAWSSDGRIIIFRRRTFDGVGFYLDGSILAVSADGGMVTELWTDDGAGFLYAHTWIQ